MQNGPGKKVFVGMSGGVDSSVTAALLKERGFDVTGVFIKVWQPEWLEGTAECTWRDDRIDAMRVCAHLKIPFVTLNLEHEYKREVVDYMIAEYKAGRTPNPDVMCNRHVKFGGFFDWAMAQGADFVATGHYAQISGTGEQKLLAGDDENKDQSYFLWTLTQKELSKTLFPVGDMEKGDVRRLARSFKLPTAEKKDSQGLCFMGKIDLKDFLSRYMEPKKGDVLDESGTVIGRHDGALFLTLGERRGFTITNKGNGDEPYYVVSKDIARNTVTVSHVPVGKHSPDGHRIKISGASWTRSAPVPGRTYGARVRYRQPLQACRIEDGETVVFNKPQIAAPGQSIVIYDGKECLGGGVVS